MQAVLPTASWRNILVAVIAAFTVNGCGSSSGPNAFYLARALNLVSDSPTQTVKIGSLSFRAAFAAGTGYSSAFAASGDIEVRGFVPGANPGDVFEDTLILKAAENTEFADSTAYTIINYGTVADFRSLIVADPVVDSVDPNSNILRVAHAASGAGNVDVYVTDPDADLTGAAPMFSLSVGQVGARQTIAFASHQIRITAAGTTNVIYDSGTLTPALPGRLMYVIGKSIGPNSVPVFLSQWYNQGPPQAVADTNSPAFVRLIHLLPDTGPLDLFAEDDYAAPLASNTSYRETSTYGTTTDSLSDGPTVFEGATIEFSGTASDAEDGTLTDALSWASSVDGPIEGSGGGVSATLTAGDHTLTASVTDSGGLTGTDAVTVRVLPLEGAAPNVSITRPPSRTSIVAGTSLTLKASAEDASDGDLSAGLSWTSSIDGLLPDMGDSVTATLSPGVHALTASVANSNNFIGSDSVIVLVTTGTDTAPEVAITGPAINSVEFDVTLGGDPDSLLLQIAQQIFNGTAYSFAVTGLSTDLNSVLLADSIQKVATHSQLRILHASALLDTFDVYITAPDSGIAGANLIFSGVPAGGVTAFGSFPGGNFDITLTSTGTTDVVLLIPSLTLGNGSINTLAIIEDTGASSPGFQLFTD